MRKRFKKSGRQTSTFFQDAIINSANVTGFLKIHKGTYKKIEYHGSRLELKNVHADTVVIYPDRNQYTDVFISKGSIIQKLVLKGKNIRVMKDSGSQINERVLKA